MSKTSVVAYLFRKDRSFFESDRTGKGVAHLVRFYNDTPSLINYLKTLDGCLVIASVTDKVDAELLETLLQNIKVHIPDIHLQVMVVSSASDQKTGRILGRLNITERVSRNISSKTLNHKLVGLIKEMGQELKSKHRTPSVKGCTAESPEDPKDGIKACAAKSDAIQGLSDTDPILDEFEIIIGERPSGFESHRITHLHEMALSPHINLVTEQDPVKQSEMDELVTDITESGHIMQRGVSGECSLIDQFDDSVVVSTKVNLSEKRKVVVELAVTYRDKSSKIQLRGEVLDILQDEKESYVTVKINDSELWRMQEFLEIRRIRERSVQEFLSRAQGK